MRSGDRKAKTAAKILAAATRRFCEHGIKPVSVANLMAEAGLTHGGFYAHFDSKDALVAEVIRHGLEESQRRMRDWGAHPADGDTPLGTIAGNYLSTAHRDAVGRGCPVPLLFAEIARGDAVARSAASVKISEIVALLAGYMTGGDAEETEAAAIAFLSTLVGGMLLARATNDARFSDRILEAGRALAPTLTRPRGRRITRRGPA